MNVMELCKNTCWKSSKGTCRTLCTHIHGNVFEDARSGISTLLIFILLILIFTTNLHAEEPEIIWRFTTGGRINTAPVQDPEGNLYFCSEDRFLYALKEDGALKWRMNLEDRVTDTLAVGNDGTLYAGSRRGFLVAINPEGKQLWKIKLRDRPFGTPAITPDGNIYLVTEEGWLYSISHIGFVRWEVKLPALPVVSPVLGNRIILGLDDERIYAYNKNGGQEWVFLLSGKAASLGLTQGGIFVGTDNATLVFMSSEGKRLWNTQLPGTVLSVSVFDKDRLVCSAGSSVSMLDSEGNILWTQRDQTPLEDTALLPDMIITLNQEGLVSWLDMEGNHVAHIRGGKPGSRLLIARDGSVYVGGSDWVFYKYAFPVTVSNLYGNRIWPSYQGGAGNRGFLAPADEKFPVSDRSGHSDYIYLRELAISRSEKNLNTLLDDIEMRLFDRKYDPGKYYLLELLEYTASEGTKRPFYDNGRLINDFPNIRSRAVEILGITGSFSSISFLADLLRFEWNGYVRISIIRSIGVLGSDMDSIITDIMTDYYARYKKNLDSIAARELLLSIRKVIEYRGRVNSDMLTIIMGIFSESSSRQVKELALDIIQSIQQR